MSAKIEEINIDVLRAEFKNGKLRQAVLFFIFLLGIVGFYILFNYSPTLTEQFKQRANLFRIPSTPSEIRQMNDVIQRYTKDNFNYVLFAFCYIYIFLQSFSLPGPAILNMLSGQLFGAYVGYVLICSCATIGASGSYWLSYTLAKGLILTKFPGAIVNFHRKVKQREKNLFFYMLFLRFAPVIPKLTINIASPIVGVPFSYFFFGSFFGNDLQIIILKGQCLRISSTQKLGWQFMNSTIFRIAFRKVLLIMAGLAVLALLPTLGQKYEKLKEQ